MTQITAGNEHDAAGLPCQMLCGLHGSLWWPIWVLPLFTTQVHVMLSSALIAMVFKR